MSERIEYTIDPAGRRIGCRVEGGDEERYLYGDAFSAPAPLVSRISTPVTVSVVRPLDVRACLTDLGVADSSLAGADALGAFEQAITLGLANLSRVILDEVLREHGLGGWDVPAEFAAGDWLPEATQFRFLATPQDSYEVAEWGFRLEGHFTRIGTQCVSDADCVATPDAPACLHGWCGEP